MVGFESNRLLRKSIPPEFICNLCQNIMNGPVQCSKCKIWVCISCSNNSKHLKCEHKYTDINKFLKNKLDDLPIKCINWQNGCSKTLKVKEIEKHEEICEFAQTDCPYQECQEKNLKTKEVIHSKNCPYTSHTCEKGCGKQMKLFELNSHDCVDWLLKVVESLKIKNNVLTEESKDIKQEQSNILNQFNATTNQLNTQIQKTTQNNIELEADNERLETEIFAEKKKWDLKFENSAKELINETMDKFNSNVVKSTKEIEVYNRRVSDQINGFLEKTNQQLFDYNTKVQVDANQIAGVPNDMKLLDLNPLKSSMMTSPNRSTILRSGSKQN